MSEIPSPLNYEVTFDSNRIIKVRGIILDNKGLPNGKAISPATLISSTLLIGNYALSKSGRLQSCAELPLRKRASTNSTKEATQVSSSNRNFSGANASNVGPESSQDYDLPFCANHESFCEWSYCRPAHRQSGCVEFEGGKFGVTINGDPAMYIFSRRSPNMPIQRNSVSFDNLGSLRSGKSQVEAPFDASRNHRMDSSRLGDSMYLVEIVYYLKMETGQVTFYGIIIIFNVDRYFCRHYLHRCLEIYMVSSLELLMVVPNFPIGISFSIWYTLQKLFTNKSTNRL